MTQEVIMIQEAIKKLNSAIKKLNSATGFTCGSFEDLTRLFTTSINPEDFVTLTTSFKKLKKNKI